MMHDTILRNGRVLDPATGRDEVADIAFDNGMVAAVGPGCRAGASGTSRVASSCRATSISTPTFIGAAHRSASTAMRSPNGAARPPGSTSGLPDPGNFPGFRKHVMEVSQTRILAYLHVSHAGIFAFAPSVMVGESQDMRLMDPDTCAAVALANKDLIRGVKVRVGAATSGRERYRATVPRARGGRPCRPTRHVPHRPPPAALHRRPEGTETRRHADPLLQAVSERAMSHRWHDQGGVLGGARTRCDLRHRARQGFVRLRRRGGDAGRAALRPTSSARTCTCSASTARRTTTWRR